MDQPLEYDTGSKVKKTDESDALVSIERTAKLALLVGVVLAIVGGIWGGTAEPVNKSLVYDLLVCGLFIGLINVTVNRVIPIVIAFGVVLIINIWVHNDAAYAPVTDLSADLAANVKDVATAFGLLLTPAAFITGVIVAFRAVFGTAEPTLDSPEEIEKPSAPAITPPQETVDIDPIDLPPPTLDVALDPLDQQSTDSRRR